MNKKFLSAILFGALMVTSTGTFVSCKDYDDDIDAINKELTDVKSQIAALQAKVDAGKWITSVSSNAAGVTINLSDGSSVNVTNGKDGAQGEAGKDGSVVEVKEGVLYIDGEATEIKVCEEAPAALPCVKVEAGELMILQADGTYAASGIKTGSVTAAKIGGLWTITVGDDVITVPGSAALSSIEIEDRYCGTSFQYYYGIVKEAAPWGWSTDGGKTFDESMEAGFYTKLDRDIHILLNPAEADGTAFDYTFRNSEGKAADVKFFEDAKPADIVVTRAASANGLWTLPAAITKKPAAEIETLRRELYLNFKMNDQAAYGLSLEATDGLGNVAVRSAYDYKITLAQAGEYDGMNREYYNLIGKEYYPTIYGPVYDYKIRLAQDAENLRWASVFGIELTADEKGYVANNETAVYNGIEFEVTGVLINGKRFNDSFTVYFTDELAAPVVMQAEALKAPLDATWNKDAGVFQYVYTYDLSDQVANLTSDAKLLWNQNIAEGLNGERLNAILIGGETPDGDNNYNEDWWSNERVRELMSWSIDKKNVLTVVFNVSEKYNAGNGWWGRNFQLNTAYQLTIPVKDPENEALTVASIVLPFEFTQPTLDITRVNGEKAIWSADGKTLSLYGDLVTSAENDPMMYAPLYEAFDGYYGYDSKGKFEWDPNAKYYTLSGNNMNRMDQGYYVNGIAYSMLQNVNLENIQISSQAAEWGTYAPIYCVNNQVTPIVANYKFYGVYPATEEQVANFNLRFASLLGDAQAVETVEASYTANNVTREVILTDEDFNLVDALGSTFFLFDGVKADGNINNRSDMNLRQGFEEGTEGFATDWTLTTVNPEAYYYKNGVKTPLTVQIGATKGADAKFVTNANTKTRYWEAVNVAGDNVIVTLLPAAEAVKDQGYAAIAGGVMIQIPAIVGTTEAVTIEFTLQDVFGVQKTLSVVVKASK